MRGMPYKKVVKPGAEQLKQDGTALGTVVPCNYRKGISTP